jgi:hypothetical protein
MPNLKEGNFVVGQTSEGIIHGVIEHIMTEGGVYGVPGTEYAIQSMPPENPAMAVRVYKKEGGTWKPTAYSIGMMYKDAQIANINSSGMDEDDDEEDDIEEMDKFDGCCPEENIEKQAPCWKGYVQRGMKPGKNGKPVPNCVPAVKALFGEFGKDYTKSKTIRYTLGE